MESWEIAAYERLRTEIVRSAVDDLRKALRKSKRLGVACDEQVRLEEWFLSKWGQVLSGDNGEYIIEKCHQTYKQRLYNSELPDDVQKQIYADYKKGMSRREIWRKYRITEAKYYRILRRWGF